MANPIEVLQRPLIKNLTLDGPSVINSDSTFTTQGSASFNGAVRFNNTVATSGATTIGGSLTVAGNFSLNTPLKVNQASAAAMISGVVAIASGGSSGIAATTHVKSNSMILVSLLQPVIASHTALAAAVSAVTDSASFTITVNSITAAAQSFQYFIINPQ